MPKGTPIRDRDRATIVSQLRQGETQAEVARQWELSLRTILRISRAAHLKPRRRKRTWIPTTYAIVVDIYEGKLKQTTIAKRYKVTRSYVCHIRARLEENGAKLRNARFKK